MKIIKQMTTVLAQACEGYKDTLRRDGGDRVLLKHMRSPEELWQWWLNAKPIDKNNNSDCQSWLW